MEGDITVGEVMTMHGTSQHARFAQSVDKAFPEVVASITAALYRHGFVEVASVDLRAELSRRLGAHVPAHLVLLAINPAMTVRILRDDPDAADTAIVAVTVRETDGVVVVEVPDPGRRARGATAEVADAISRRLIGAVTEALH
jgi:uncharacterized protein (DUF302 family)